MRKRLSIPITFQLNDLLFLETLIGKYIAIAGTIRNQNKIAVSKFHPINIENGIKTAINAIGTINVPLSFSFNCNIIKYNNFPGALMIHSTGF